MPRFSAEAILPNLFGVHIGWVIALVLVVVVYLFLNNSKTGFEIAILGESENTARYAGINISKTVLVAVCLSGALCGLTGIIQASAVNNELSSTLANGIGYTAIITTWLSGLSAPVIVLVCTLFAALTQGASYIQTAFGIPSAAASVLQALILCWAVSSSPNINLSGRNRVITGRGNKEWIGGFLFSQRPLLPELRCYLPH
jgi:simple sugar transport system permease protein